MPEPRFSIAQRRVGLELRRLRTAAGKTLDDVATVMEWSPSKVSRVETGESRILARDVRFLCQALGAEADVAEALVELVKAAKVKGWWEPYRDVLGGNYIPFEAAADEVNEFQMEVVCALWMEWFEILHLFTDTDKLDRLACNGLQAQRRATARIAIQLG